MPGTVEGSRPEEDSRFPQFQPHPAGLLHRHHVTVHTRAGVAQRATPRWPGSSARGAGTVVPAGPTRVGPEAAEGPASPRQRSHPRAFPPASPRPRRPAPPTARGAQGGRAPRASTRPKQGPGGHAHLRHPAPPPPAAGDSGRGAPRPAGRPCGDLAGQPSSAGAVSPEGRPLLSGRGAAAGKRAPPSRPRPLGGPAPAPALAAQTPPTSHRHAGTAPSLLLSTPGVIGPLPEMNTKRRGKPSTKMSCDILLMAIIYSKSSLD